MELQTNRLMLRPMVVEDAMDMYQLNLDADVLRYTGDKPFKSIQEARSFLKSYNQFYLYKLGRFTISLLSTGNYVGWCGLRKNNDGRVDLGFRIKKEYWGRGMATEAGKASLSYGFEQIGLKTIVAKTHIENITSQRVIEKLGFEYVEKGEDVEIGEVFMYSQEME